jgi:hypothetical protein
MSSSSSWFRRGRPHPFIVVMVVLIASSSHSSFRRGRFAVVVLGMMNNMFDCGDEVIRL